MSSSIRAHRLAFRFSDRAPIFEDASFHLAPGWTGLVGENGAGKTTLLRLIQGVHAPERGQVRVEPPSASIALCPQTVSARSLAMDTLAASVDRVATRLRGLLDLDPGALDRWDTLSPGERKRWQVGAALAAEPDVLLLDEPTNHLDAPARALLVAALARHHGVGIVVSHDRALLADLTTATLRVHRGDARLWPLAYDAARAAWELEEQAGRDAHDSARKAERATARRLDDARREGAAAEASTSTGRRMKDRHDHDARGALAKGRAAAAEKKLGRVVEVRRREHERAAEALAGSHVDKALGRSLFVGYERAPRAHVLAIDTGAVHAGPRVLLSDVHLAVGRDDRVRVEGPNGAGKTTLVRALLDASRLPPDRVLYLPQDLGEDAERALLAETRARPPAERERVLSAVAALGVDPDRLLGSARPSPGEARKLAIASGLARHVWALVLDEPTNHLDLPSIERLEQALSGYPGALVLVTHDRAFGRRAARTVWHVERGSVRVASQVP